MFVHVFPEGVEECGLGLVHGEWPECGIRRRVVQGQRIRREGRQAQQPSEAWRDFEPRRGVVQEQADLQPHITIATP